MVEEASASDEVDIVCEGRRIGSTIFINRSRRKLASLLVRASCDSEARMAERKIWVDCGETSEKYFDLRKKKQAHLMI